MKDRSKYLLDRYGEVEIEFKAYFKGECVYSGVAHSGSEMEAVIYTDDDK